MSFDISLVDPVTRESLYMDTPHLMQGATYCLGGTQEMWLSVTYNYSIWYRKDGVFPDSEDGIRSLNGVSGADSIPILKHAILALENMTEDLSEEERERYERRDCTGYWLPTRENAIKPLYSLLAFAKLRPDGIWESD